MSALVADVVVLDIAFPSGLYQLFRPGNVRVTHEACGRRMRVVEFRVTGPTYRCAACAADVVVRNT